MRYQTPEQLYAVLQKKLSFMMSDEQIQEKAQIAYQIHQLKKEKNAIILGHNYMEPALYHSIPDFTGDSLYLSKVAATTNADRIVFCGVQFMAETAKILNPTKKVLIPSLAGCSLAASITAEDVRNLKKQYPGVPVVSYINTYAEVKAETDICCTSANAAKIVAALPNDQIIFLPDEYLAKNVAQETGKTIIIPPAANTAQIIGWHGKCEVHERFTVEDIQKARSKFPDILVIAHPECHPDVVEQSNFSGSTTQIIDFVKNNPTGRYLILTECAMSDNIAAEVPTANLMRLCMVRCPHMQQITLEQTLWALENDQYEITIPEEIRQKALRSVERMLEF